MMFGMLSQDQREVYCNSKWIYKIKHAADDTIEKYKARFVVRGFSQKEQLDYEETFAPVARYTCIRSVLSLAAVMKCKIHQIIGVIHSLSLI